jgi:hypothetical protein
MAFTIKISGTAERELAKLPANSLFTCHRIATILRLTRPDESSGLAP